ncbi:MAG: molybdopterin-dependent oxidoreductase, partial [Deltaproteobacteria bacterium]|nr:molybdopterin-dependent oxidoreductase [Deltaproteobacteria bacterium]
MAIAAESRKEESSQGRWIPTACFGCFSMCGVLAYVEDGVVQDVKGNPESPISQGKICAKGKSKVLSVYDPSRVLYPMCRTNPEKGIGVDPHWREMSWEEALDTIAAKLKEVRAKDPRRLIIATWDTSVMSLVNSWAAA